MKILKTVLLSLLAICFVSCASNNINNSSQKTEKSFPTYSYTKESIGTGLSCPVEGAISSVETNKRLSNIVILCSEDYFWEGQLQTIEYEFVIYNVEDFTNIKFASMNEMIGTITAETKFTARSTSLNPFMVRLTNAKIVSYGDYYYFLPAWIMPDRTNWLNYRQIDDFDEQVCDFYNRWKVENDGMNEDASAKNNWTSLFNYQYLDSVRFKTQLTEYPSDINRTVATGFTEKSYFGRSIFMFETPIKSSCPYEPVLYWQSGFDEYLENEYELGTDIYIYCTFLALDHENKKIIVNIRDFATTPDEDVVEARIADIEKL